MAEKHTAHKKGAYHVVSGPPDCCVVNGATVPFDISRPLDKASVHSPNVNVQGTRVLRVGDVIAGVDGDAGAGVASGTAMGGGDNVIIEGAPKVNSGGVPVARHESAVLMNVGAGPNTVGHLVIDQSPPLAPVNGGVVPCNNPPATSERLEELQALREKLGFMDPDQLDEWVRFNDTSKILDGWISQIDVTPDGGLLRGAGNILAQGTRGVLGFVKDGALGLGNLLYSAGKMATPGGQILGQIDQQILMEQIRLGNVCLETLKQAAKAAGKELARPVIEAWEKGNKVEAVTRAGLEIGTLVFAIGDVAKLASAARAGEIGAAGARTAGTVSRETAAVGRGGSAAGREGAALGREGAAAGREGAAAGREGAAAGREGGAVPEGGGPPRNAPEGKPATPDTPEAKPKAGDEGGGGGDKPPDGEAKPAGDEGGGGDKPPGDNGAKVRKPGESKGAFGERMTEEELAKRGYERISKDKNPNANGIDGVYKNKNPPPDYVIVESKYGTSTLKQTQDGLQMSDDWINGTNSGFDRLTDAVGSQSAAEIRAAIANGGVDKVLANIDAAGNVSFRTLNNLGKPTGKWP